LNVWVDLINSLSIHLELVRSRVQYPHWPLLRVRGKQPERPKRQQIRYKLICQYFYNPESQVQFLFKIVSQNLKMHLSQHLKAIEQFKGRFWSDKICRKVRKPGPQYLLLSKNIGISDTCTTYDTCSLKIIF